MTVSSMHTKQRNYTFGSMLFALLSLTVFLTACGGTTATQATSTTATSNTCDKTTGLTLYSAQGYDSDVAKAFQQQTGIPVKLVDDSTGNLLAKITAERNNPQWDVAWFDGNVTMQTLDDQGLLLKWDSTGLNTFT